MAQNHSRHETQDRGVSKEKNRQAVQYSCVVRGGRSLVRFETAGADTRLSIVLGHGWNFRLLTFDWLELERFLPGDSGVCIWKSGSVFWQNATQREIKEATKSHRRKTTAARFCVSRKNGGLLAEKQAPPKNKGVLVFPVRAVIIEKTRTPCFFEGPCFSSRHIQKPR